MRRRPSLLPLFLLLSAFPRPAFAAPGAGTLEDPIRVDDFPYAIRGSTLTATSDVINSYACSPNTNESGHEVVFAFELKTKARVSAWVTGDSAQVDIDVHVLSDLTLSGGISQSCVARSNTYTEADLPPGKHFIVVDTFNSEVNAGPFVLRLDAASETWSERFVAEGVALRSRRYEDPLAGPEVINALRIDVKNPAVSISVLPAMGCQTIAELGASAGAVAGINGGFFAGATCSPASFTKHANKIIAQNSLERGVWGLDAAANPSISLVAAGADWTSAVEAQGGGPILVEMAKASKGALAWAKEGFTSPPFLGKNPRTLAAINAEGDVLLATVDGGRANASGMSLDELAAFSVAELGANSALNLDGAESTTLWVDSQTPSGLVNYPSGDPGQELPTHPGARAVAGGIFVFAPPYAHPPRFQTEPATDAEIGKLFSYDADAIDLDLDDTILFSLGSGPPGLTIDAATGVVSYTPPADAYAETDVVLLATDNTGLATEQAFTLKIPGGIGSGSGGGGGGGGGGADGGGGGSGGADGGGCGCVLVGGEGVGSTCWFGVLGLLSLVCRRRRIVCSEAQMLRRFLRA